MESWRNAKAFLDGFGGGLAGGVVYWLCVDYLYLGVPEFPWVKVLPLAAAFGLIELYRVARRQASGRA